MLNERLNATRPILASLKGAEESLNNSVRQIGTLLVDIANAKDAKGTRFSLTAGVAATEKAAMAALSAIHSYQHMISAHEHLAEDRDLAGLPAKAFGDVYCPKQPSGSDVSEPVTLRAVGD